MIKYMVWFGQQKIFCSAFQGLVLRSSSSFRYRDVSVQFCKISSKITMTIICIANCKYVLFGVFCFLKNIIQFKFLFVAFNSAPLNKDITISLLCFSSFFS